MHILWFVSVTIILLQDAARVAAQKFPGTPNPCYSIDRALPLNIYNGGRRVQSYGRGQMTWLVSGSRGIFSLNILSR